MLLPRLLFLSWTSVLYYSAIANQVLRLSNVTAEYPIPDYEWREVDYESVVNKKPDPLRGTPARVFTKGKPVYVSLTTMDSRIHQVDKSIMQILKGSIVPDHVYLFISREKYILDNGIPEDTIPTSLLEITKMYPVSVIYTQNIGPHRKLLPLLAKKWNEDCIIITIDDESKTGLDAYVRQLLKYYLASKRSSIVALKVRRIGFCDKYPWYTRHYTKWGEIKYGVREMMVLPTGTGGVLYQPNFFHPVIFDDYFRNLTSKTDDLCFRLSSMINRVAIVVGCRDRHTTSNGTPTVRYRCPYSATVKSKIEWDLSAAIYDPFKHYNHPPTMAPTAKPNGRRSDPTSKSSRPKSRSRKPSKSSKSRSKDKDSVERGRYLAASKSLYGQFNRFDGNDKAWASATRYLSHKGLLNMADLASVYIPEEREGCLRQTNSTKKRSSTCMLYKCD